MSAISEYPLCWPTGWRRTPASDRKPGVFKTGKALITFYAAEKRVQEEIWRLCQCHSDHIIMSSNMLRTRQPDDPGIAVYFTMGGKPRVLAVDVYTLVEQNLAAIAATIEAMRAIDRHGGATILERAFTGFTALSAPKSFREVLNLPAGATLELAEKHYKALAMKHHPDKGGDAGQFAEASTAIAEARKELK